MIKGIIFDVDGVLVDSEKYINQAGIELFSSFGAKAKEEDFKQAVGGGELSFVVWASKFYKFQLDKPQLAVDRLYSIYERIVSENNMGPMPGVVQFIKNCRKAGLKIALGSSAQITKVRINLKRLGFELSDFDAVVDATSVERTKPFPDIFASCVYRLGLLPEECLVFEDALNGLRSAKSAGCMGGGITGWFKPEELLLSGADVVYENLGQFPVFSDVEEFNSILSEEIEKFCSISIAGKLIEKASNAMLRAYAKYSNFKVGAAILTDSGRIYCGCNVENASFGGTICAERNAATTAVAEEGPNVRFSAIAITSEAEIPAPPCAICRQFLCEFMGPDAQVWLYSTKSKVLKHYNFGTVMPFVFEL